ncbi:MAG: GNAT family N-acetyltransferase [Verrucomicrobiales bacterium]
MKTNFTSIRLEEPNDHALVRVVNEQSFNRVGEADLVDKLRAGCANILSLVAICDHQIVGHCLFSPVTIRNDHGEIQGMGLGPVAVLPCNQRQGIGSQLIKAGLGILRERDCPFVVVLGHPDYYSRFDFTPASWYGISCQWPGIPDNVFMALILDSKRMEEVSGVARYRDEFNEVT